MWKDWFDQTDDFNQISWVWLGQWSTEMITLTLLLVLFILWLSWHNSTRLTRGRRVTLMTLRSLTLTLFFLLFLQPAARLEDVTRVKNHIAILVDHSRSMTLPGAALNKKKNRIEEALETLDSQASALAQWSEDHHVDLYYFDTHLTNVQSIEELKVHPPRGEGTSLNTPLEELLTRTPPEDLAAVIILSDGVDNSGGASKYMLSPPPQLTAVAQQMKVPIHTLTFGPLESPKDVAIAEVKADEFAFARNAVNIEVDVLIKGYPAGARRQVTLKRGHKQLGQRVIFHQKGRDQYSVEFEFVPEETGEEVYTVEVESDPDEQITQNNLARFSMRVIRDKIRVLQVVGRPSWDERFLRKHLKKNPNVELISFFILRTNASIETATPDELSLIPFPTQELFEERLGSFDLMIFQNFTYRGYRMKRYLPLIKDYVHNGGGFVMLGGDQSFNRGGYTGTSIAEMLPVLLPPKNTPSVDLGDFTPQLSPTGVRHPVTTLSLIPEENRRLWSTLPQLGGTNQTIGVKEGAQVLAWRPRKGQDSQPLIISSDYGEGRTLAITTDSLWRWAFSDQNPLQAKGAQAYHKFWGNTIRWLIRDPALNPMKVNTDHERYALGSTVTLNAQVLSEEYTPLKGVSVSLIIEDVSRGVESGEQLAVLSAQSQEQGEVSVKWRPKKEGAYRVRAVAQNKGAELSAQDLFIVAEDPLEYREVAPYHKVMAWYAQESGGTSLRGGESWASLKRVTPKVMKVNRRKDIPLWSGGWVLLIALLLPVLEWIFRRHWGLS